MLDSSKQEGFSQSIAAGSNQHDAYMANFQTSNMLPSTIDEAASRLAAGSKVAARILELREQVTAAVVAETVWDQRKFIKEADKNLQGSRAANQWAPANGALQLIGKVAGLLVDKVDVNVTHTLQPGLTLEELEARMQRLDALEAGVVEGKAVVLEDSDETSNGC